MGLEPPPEVLKLLAGQAASGLASGAKFVAAFERHFDAERRKRGAAIGEDEVSLVLQGPVLEGLRSRGPHALRRVALDLEKARRAGGVALDAFRDVLAGAGCSLDEDECRAVFATFDPDRASRR